MHLFSAPHNKFCGQKMATKEPFLNHSNLFPLKKVEFLVPKIPIGEKVFFVLLSKENKGARSEEKARYG